MGMEFGAVLSLRDQLTSPLKSAGRGLNKFEGQAKSANKVVGFLDKSLGSLVAGFGAIAAIGKAFQLGGELGETQNKFNVVFGEMAADTEKWITKMSNSWNKSTLSIKTALATNQDMLTGFGATRREAASLSKQFVTAATDLASFSNVPAAEAMDRWTKGMLGAHENLTAMGIVLNDVNLTLRASTLGFKKNFRELSPLQKMQVRYAEATSQSKNSLGDATNTAWDWVNVMQGIKAITIDTTAAIGVGLTSAFVGLGRDALSALKVMSVGQDQARTAGEALEPVVRNLTKAFVAYKIVQGASWLLSKRIAAIEIINKGILLAKTGVTVALATATIAYSAATLGASGITGVFTGSMAALNAVMFANPIGLIVLAVGAIGIAFIAAFKHSETFRSGVTKLWETMKKIPILGAVLRIGEATVKFFSGTGETPEEAAERNKTGAALGSSVINSREEIKNNINSTESGVAKEITNNTNRSIINRNNSTSSTKIDISGNTFTVREEADIEKIAGALADEVEKRQGGMKR